MTEQEKYERVLIAILDRINIQARNLMFLHKIGIGKGPVNVSPKTCETLLIEMGRKTVEIVFEESRCEYSNQVQKELSNEQN